MHCCPRPSASGNSASGHPQHLVGDSLKASGNSASGHPQHLVGDSFDCCTERYEIVVYCIPCLLSIPPPRFDSLI